MFIRVNAPRSRSLRPESSAISESDWKILSDFWYPVALASEVGSTPVKATLLDVELVLYRNAQDEVTAALDMCPHRLVRLSGGKVIEGQITCPFHGLRFDGTGRCTLVPVLGDKGKLPPAYRVQVFPVKEQYGLLWVCLGDAGKNSIPRFDSLLDAPVEELAHTSSSVWPISAPRQIENFFDLAHLPYVHANTLGGDPFAQLKPGQVEHTDDAVILTAKYRETSHGEHLCDYRYRVVLPFALEFRMQAEDDPEHSLVSCDIPSPMSAYKCRVFQIVRTKLPFEARPEMAAAFEGINAEDIGVLSQMRIADMPLDQHHEIHLPVDNISIAYRTRLRNLGLGQSPISVEEMRNA